ncbi:adaptin N terminal region-domain-containing protein, partial [Chytriomyces cf. hyalinus JEL632]
MFEKSLHDLIRGIRANASQEERFIRTCLDEMRAEVKKTDLDIKATAVAKLFYLHMLGYDMNWAAFHIIEVMSSHVLWHKRIGYIAAAISFRQDTNVLMLCTNLIKKDLQSNNYLEAALALNGLCTIVTPDLGRDLSPDLIAMMNHSRAYIRKRVILCLYKVFLKYPEALRVAVPRLKDRLEDSDPSVVSAAVNVVCELARKNPKSYLPLAPQLFTILNTSTNNWLLIKIVKLFGALCPLEPRLIKKLVNPITNLIQTTSAMSLAYECILTAITGGMISAEHDASLSVDGANATLSNTDRPTDSILAKICVSKLKVFIADSDQNLKYLGLFALCKLLPLRPKAVGEHRDIILDCLEDNDISIRMRALELVSSMVSKKNVVVIVEYLIKQLIPSEEDEHANDMQKFASSTSLHHQQPTSAKLTLASDSTYGNEVISRILSFCSKDTYALVSDFQWYVGALIRFVKVRGAVVGLEVAGQLMDVCVRVEGVRDFAVNALTALIMDESFLESTAWEKNNTDVLFAAAWIVGEYSRYVSNPQELIQYLINPRMTRLSATVQSSYVQAALKVYAAWLSGNTKQPQNSDLMVLDESAHTKPSISKEEFAGANQYLLQGMSKLSGSIDLEVQERASNAFQILTLINSLEAPLSLDGWTVPDAALDLATLFVGELNPVNPQAQSLVPVPEGLDLDAWIHDPEPDVALDEISEVEGYGDDGEGSLFGGEKKSGKKESRKAAADRKKDDPFYIGNDQTSLDKDDEASKTKTKKTKKSTQIRDLNLFDSPPAPSTEYAINRNDELPKGAVVKSLKDKLKFLEDEDTMAVRSVDLSSPASAASDTHRLGWEVNRAALLSEPTPQLKDVGVEVVRKKKGGSSKKDAESEVSGGKKKKKTKKAEEQNGLASAAVLDSHRQYDEPAVGASHGDEFFDVELNKKPSRGASILSETSNVALMSSTVAVEPEPLPPLLASVFETMEADEIAGLSSFKLCLEKEEFLLGFDWTSLGRTSEDEICLSACLLVYNSSEIASSSFTFTIAPGSNCRVTSVDGSDLVKLESGPVPVAGFGKMLLKVFLKTNSALEPASVGATCMTESGVDTFALTIPAMAHFAPACTITPTGFAECLSNPANCPHASSIQFPVPSVDDFSTLVHTLAKRLRLTIVEEVSMAVSVYGRSIGSKGGVVHVAGLIKARLKAPKPANAMMKALSASANAAGSAGGIVSFELKCGSAALIDVLIEEVNDFSSTL